MGVIELKILAMEILVEIASFWLANSKVGIVKIQTDLSRFYRQSIVI
jgi:hypothetical protein